MLIPIVVEGWLSAKASKITELRDVGGTWLSAQSNVVSYKLRTLLVLSSFSDLNASHCAGVVSHARYSDRSRKPLIQLVGAR